MFFVVAFGCRKEFLLGPSLSRYSLRAPSLGGPPQGPVIVLILAPLQPLARAMSTVDEPAPSGLKYVPQLGANILREIADRVSPAVVSCSIIGTVSGVEVPYQNRSSECACVDCTCCFAHPRGYVRSEDCDVTDLDTQDLMGSFFDGQRAREE